MTAPAPPLALPVALTDAIVFTGEAFVENQALLMEGGHIVDLVSNNATPPAFQRVSCANHILAPAYIDAQVNGGGNVLFNATPTAEAVHAIAAAHRKSGTTRLLPTCITDTPEVMRAAIEATRQARKTDSSILGIHLEGPHISQEKKGTHNPAFIREMNADDLLAYTPQKDEVMLVTLAPEAATPETIADLCKRGVIVSLGHSAATTAQANAAFAAGASGVTHLYNGMSMPTAREPGLAGAALDAPHISCGIIGDLAHVAPEMLRIAVRAKAEGKLFLVSDAMPPAGAETPLPFDLCGIKVFPKDGVCVNERGGLAGAMLTLGECVPRCIAGVRLDPEKVLRMASTIPAQFLGIGDRFGKLLPTYTADVVMLDHSFKAEAVWQDGVRV